MAAAGDRGGGPQTGVVAQLSVRRGRAAVEFYKAAFGAEEVYRVGGTDQHEAVVSRLAIGTASFWARRAATGEPCSRRRGQKPGPRQRMDSPR